MRGKSNCRAANNVRKKVREPQWVPVAVNGTGINDLACTFNPFDAGSGKLRRSVMQSQPDDN